MSHERDIIATALDRITDRGLTSYAELDQNGECANMVDGLFAIARAINRLAAATEAKRGNDATDDPGF